MTRKLHIGGTAPLHGWEIYNIAPGENVDHAGNANDLSRFPDHCFSEIYASHILEHLDYRSELSIALKEWHRVLQPNGVLYVSVPDLDTLAELFLSKNTLTFDERFFVMRMMFGGHVDKHDYHIAGLNEEFLRAYLLQAGFQSVVRVDEFNIFDDASSLRHAGTLISLNIIAQKRGGII